jgi:hypothetical protein
MLPDKKMTKSPFDTLMEVSTGFVLPRTLHVIAELGIADALEDFFEDTLPVCDAYLMTQILHDWSNQIMKAIRCSAPPHGKLLLAEWLIPEDSEQSWTLFVDLIMLGELTGKERTKPEFAKLLGDAGFRLDRVIDIGCNTFLLEATVI